MSVKEDCQMVCANCRYCQLSFNLYYCELWGIRVRADETCRSFESPPEDGDGNEDLYTELG